MENDGSVHPGSVHIRRRCRRKRRTTKQPMPTPLSKNADGSGTAVPTIRSLAVTNSARPPGAPVMSVSDKIGDGDVKPMNVLGVGLNTEKTVPSLSVALIVPPVVGSPMKSVSKKLPPTAVTLPLEKLKTIGLTVLVDNQVLPTGPTLKNP